MKRIFLHSYNSSKIIQNGQVKLDIYLSSSDGEKYVWTPDWKRGARQLFEEAYRVIDPGEPQSLERQVSKPATTPVPAEEEKEEFVDFELLAFRLGGMLKHQASFDQINKAASTTFNFEVVTHPNDRITNIHSQTIYDWIMTLAKQTLSGEEKLKLLKEFAGTLANKNSPLGKATARSHQRLSRY